jgi:hypothetical protein
MLIRIAYLLRIKIIRRKSVSFNPVNNYNFNNINYPSVNNLPELEKDAEMPISEFSHLSLDNLPKPEEDAEMPISDPFSQWTNSNLWQSLHYGQHTLLEITKIVVAQPQLSDETLREIENAVDILHKRQKILIITLKSRGAL